MFCLLPDPPQETAGDRLKRKARTLFSKKEGYQYRFIRVSVRDGLPTLVVHESEDSDDVSLAMFYLTAVLNVHRCIVPVTEKLQFVTYDDNGFVSTETVFGQIGLILELEVDAGGGESPRNQGMPGTKNTEEVRLAFSTTDEREAWLEWFSELVVLREKAEIEGTENEEPAEVTIASPRKLLSSHQGKGAVKEYLRVFLQSAATGKGGPGGADTLPNKGKILARAPDSTSFLPFAVTGNKIKGEVTLTPKKKKFGGKVKSVKFLMMDAVVVAPLPWNPEFQLTISDSKLWQFQAAQLEQRNTFITWFRIVKGRGNLAQTDDQTFPYLAAERMKEDHDAVSAEIAHRFGAGRRSTVRFPDALGNSSDEDDADSDLIPDDGSQESPRSLGEGMRENDELSDRSSPSLSSIHTMDSVRPFRPFPSFQGEVVQHYILECALPHMFGRSLPLGSGSSLSNLNRPTAIAAAALLDMYESPLGMTPKGRGVTVAETVATPGDGSPGPAGPRRGSGHTKTHEYISSATYRRAAYQPTGTGARYVVEPSSATRAGSTSIIQQTRTAPTSSSRAISPLGAVGGRGVQNLGKPINLKRTPVPSVVTERVRTARKMPDAGQSTRSAAYSRVSQAAKQNSVQQNISNQGSNRALHADPYSSSLSSPNPTTQGRPTLSTAAQRHQFSSKSTVNLLRRTPLKTTNSNNASHYPSQTEGEDGMFYTE